MVDFGDFVRGVCALAGISWSGAISWSGVCALAGISWSGAERERCLRTGRHFVERQAFRGAAQSPPLLRFVVGRTHFGHTILRRDRPCQQPTQDSRGHQRDSGPPQGSRMKVDA